MGRILNGGVRASKTHLKTAACRSNAWTVHNQSAIRNLHFAFCFLQSAISPIKQPAYALTTFCAFPPTNARAFATAVLSNR
jgi:hypothetical protein